MRLFLGLDLGTSAVKAVALDEHGRILASAHEPYPTHAPHPGWAEQDPDDWMAAAVRALHQVVDAAPGSATAEALAVAGQLPTLAVLDHDGRPLRPAIVWYDGRAGAEAAAMQRAIGPEEWRRRSGIILDAHYLAPMYAWVAAHEPSLLGRDHWLCGAKDMLVNALSGAFSTDPSTASGYGVFAPIDGRWDATLCALAGLNRAVLPPVVEPWSSAGGLVARVAHATGLSPGLPIVTGAADSLAGVLGCGAATAGAMAAITGTSTALVVSVGVPVLDSGHRFLLTPHAVPGLWGVEMDLMATGATVQWLARTLGLAHLDDVERLAAQSPAGARGLIALPYLAGGEQGALWDPHAPGALVGLSCVHGPSDVARATIEGIVCEMRRCVLTWADAGVPVGEVILTGAGSSPFFAHLVAAALDRPVQVSRLQSASAAGAALLAGFAVRAWDLATMTTIARTALDEPVTDSGDAVARFAAVYERYDHVSSTLRQAAHVMHLMHVT